MADSNTERRITMLEAELRHTQAELAKTREEVKSCRERLGYYDKITQKTWGVAIGILGVFTAIGMGVDKLKDKIASWVWP